MAIVALAVVTMVLSGCGGKSSTTANDDLGPAPSGIARAAKCFTEAGWQVATDHNVSPPHGLKAQKSGGTLRAAWEATSNDATRGFKQFGVKASDEAGLYGKMYWVNQDARDQELKEARACLGLEKASPATVKRMKADGEAVPYIVAKAHVLAAGLAMAKCDGLVYAAVRDNRLCTQDELLSQSRDFANGVRDGSIVIEGWDESSGSREFSAPVTGHKDSKFTFTLVNGQTVELTCEPTDMPECDHGTFTDPKMTR